MTTTSCDLFLIAGAALLVAGGCGAQRQIESVSERDPRSAGSNSGGTGGAPARSAGSNSGGTGGAEAGSAGSHSGGTGGAAAGGSSGGEDTVADGSAQYDEEACAVAATPCGGDVVGTWNVLGCPLELTGEVDLWGFGLGCVSARITSGSLEVSGTWSADAMGNVSDTTITKGVQEFELPAACFDVAATFVPCDRLPFPLSTLGYDTVECVDNTEMGGCSCSGTFNQQGGLAAISTSPLVTGSYSAGSTLLTTSELGDETTYEHCVMEDTMVLTLPEPRGVGLVVGSLVLRRQ